MKLSLSWIFDHISSRLSEIDVEKLVSLFNTKTAEIEHYEKLSINVNNFALGKVISSNTEQCSVEIPEWKIQANFPCRSGSAVGDIFLVYKKGGEISWASYQDFDQDRDGLIAKMSAAPEDLSSGAWKKGLLEQDWILEIDNKSITHRPDMWGHRGFAREVAMLLNLDFKPESDFLKNVEVRETESTSQNLESGFSFKNEEPGLCKAFTATRIEGIENKACLPKIAFRLLVLGAKPINAIVDLTNYLLMDWAQPTHAYDADAIENKKVIVRRASEGEKLDLLGGGSCELTSEDLVVASGSGAMCLAGVKGGQDHSVRERTKNLLFEAANFDATSVRRSSLRHKVRTDSSARFEKTLDVSRTVTVVKRFLNLADQFGIGYTLAGPIHFVGQKDKEVVVNVSHKYLEQGSGLHLTSAQIISVLEKLEFKVANDNDEVYKISVPSFRSSKDVKEAHDILEEVVRSIGFDNIPSTIPPIHRKPYNLSGKLTLRNMKRYLAYGCDMIEQANYPTYDEEFISSINYQPAKGLEIINPVSQNAYRLVHSLIPGLLANIQTNYSLSDNLSFFEVASVWDSQDNEKKILSGLFFNKKSNVDFYSCKSKLDGLTSVLGRPPFAWEKSIEKSYPWQHQHQTSNLFLNGQLVGSAGKVDPSILGSLGFLPESDGFLFEIELAPLSKKDESFTQFVQIPSHLEHNFDLSFLVDIAVTVDDLQKFIISCDELIVKVSLLDIFEKDEWQDRRSLAFRIFVLDNIKPLSRQEIENIQASVQESLVERFSVEIR